MQRNINVLCVSVVGISQPFCDPVAKPGATNWRLAFSSITAYISCHRRSCVGKASLSEFDACPWSLIFAGILASMNQSSYRQKLLVNAEARRQYYLLLQTVI